MTSSWEVDYGGVLLAVFANQICLPVPSIVVLMAAGAISAHGGMRPSIVIPLSMLACISADCIWFWLGRKWGSRVIRVLSRFSDDPRGYSNRARARFHRHGLPLLCVAKFVPGLDGLLPPLSGAEGVSIPCFLALDAVGSFLWSSAYVGVGRLFADQLDAAIGWVQHFGTALGIVVGVPVAAYAVLRALTLLGMIRRLRLRRISPLMLARALKSKSKVAVLDLSSFEEESDENRVDAIPGAFRVDPLELRQSPRLTVPGDVKMILYSSSGEDRLSARVALGLRRIGVNNVWVLEGGLKAWRAQGLPIAHSFEPPELIAARVGVKLPNHGSPKSDTPSINMQYASEL